MLSGTQTFKLSIHHNRQSCTQSLALFHANTKKRKGLVYHYSYDQTKSWTECLPVDHLTEVQVKERTEFCVIVRAD